MPVKLIIQNGLRINALLLVLIFCIQPAGARVNEALPAIVNDSVPVIKQLLREHIIQQLKLSGTYQNLEQSRWKKVLNDSTAMDSLGNLVLQQMQQFEKGIIHTSKSVAMETWQNSKQILQQPFNKLMQLQNIKELISQFAGVIKQPLLQWKGGSLDIAGQTVPSLFNSSNVFINSNTLIANWSVLGIPMGMQLIRQDFTGPEYSSRTAFSFQFDRESWLHSLRDKIKPKVDPADLLSGYNKAFQIIKDAAWHRLRSTLDSINTMYADGLSKQLEKLGTAENVFKEDIQALQDKLLSVEFLRGVEQQKNLLAQMQQQLNTGHTVNMVLYDSLLQSVQAVTGVNKIVNVIRSFKDEVKKSGLLEKLKEAGQFKNNNLQQCLQDPDKLKSLAKEQLDLNAMQKFFLNMSQLKIGINTVSLSPLTIYQYANTGFNATFINNRNYLFIMAGKQAAFNSLFGARFTGPLFSPINISMGLRMGKGDIAENHTHISLFTFRQAGNSYSNTAINTVPGNTLVAGFSNRLKINETNCIDIEISKSGHKYTNEQRFYDTLQQGRNLLKQVRDAENFMQQMAFTVQWQGESKEKELGYNVYGSRTGKGYTNPGNLFLSGGASVLGGSLRKDFFQKQLQLSAKGDYRAYEYSSNNIKWCNYNFSLQGKLKLKRGQYISLRYHPCQSVRWQGDKRYSTGKTTLFSLDGNFRKRFGRINYQHTISLSVLKNIYPFDSIPFNNSSALISSMQTFAINKGSYYLNTQYNRASVPSALIVFNTQLNVEAGCMYTIRNGIMGSTAINYNSTKEWFRQLGIRQTISGQAGKRFIVSVYADIVKNIKVYRPGYINNTRFEWSLQYLLK